MTNDLVAAAAAFVQATGTAWVLWGMSQEQVDALRRLQKAVKATEGAKL